MRFKSHERFLCVRILFFWLGVRWVVFPESKLRRMWDIVMMLLLAYAVVVMPLRAGAFFVCTCYWVSLCLHIHACYVTLFCVCTHWERDKSIPPSALIFLLQHVLPRITRCHCCLLPLHCCSCDIPKSIDNPKPPGTLSRISCFLVAKFAKGNLFLVPLNSRSPKWAGGLTGTKKSFPANCYCIWNSESLTIEIQLIIFVDFAHRE